MSKLDDKINAVISFVEDCDDHPEITLGMLRRCLDDNRLAMAEARESWRADAGTMFGLWVQAMVLGRGLAALVERTMEPYDEDTWRDWVRDCAENAEDPDDWPGPEAEVECCEDHGPTFAGRCHECEHDEMMVEWALERRAFGE